MDAMKLDPKVSGLGAASGDMLNAWAKAWETTVTGRVLPAMELMNPANWGQGGQNVADALENVLGTPQWSDFLSLDSETMKSFAPTVELAQIGQQYAAAVTRISTAICGKFQQRLAATGLKLDGSGEALDLWNDIVDETLMEFNRSETFGDMQRRFLRSLMAHRLERRRMVGRLAEHFDLPTREEMDELSRRVHDLERELRRLRRAFEAPPPSKRSNK